MLKVNEILFRTIILGGLRALIKIIKFSIYPKERVVLPWILAEKTAHFVDKKQGFGPLYNTSNPPIPSLS